ncbi:MAG TPA: type I methionyl aminopeptidase [Pseudomonadales bacterium]|nr:type I methionyl aminopeptidase [Pseudomonadales bacterium]
MQNANTASAPSSDSAGLDAKFDEKVAGMRAAGRAAASVLEMITEHVRPGITTGALDKLCHDFIVDELGCIPAPLNYQPSPGLPPFPRSVCTSVNHVVCHGIPSDKKKLKAGDLLNIDVTVIKDGWHGDTSKMFAVGGDGGVLGERLMRVTQECLYRGIAEVRPGATLGDIGHAIETHARAERFSVVHEYCGHGIGRAFHESPQILHYGKPGQGQRLEAGMTFTIEPMINAGKRHVNMLPDHWTVVTKDHRPSAQWEHTLLVTADGVEILTLRAEETFSP